MATLTILGTMSGAPEPDAGCSAYLVEHEGERLLLDIGPGSLRELRRHGSVHGVTAVFITHLHTDHFLDLLPFNTALWTEPREGPRMPIPVYLPPGGEETVRAAFAALQLNVVGTTAARYEDALLLHTYGPHEVMRAGEVAIEALGPTDHATTAFGFRVTGPGWTLGYTGDTAPCPTAESVGQDVDVFLAECTYPEPGTSPAARHTSAVELAEMATRLRPGMLVATHFSLHWPRDPAQRRDAITAGIRGAGYPGPLAVAEPGMACSL